MSQDATYHRTVLPDGPFESDCRQSCHGNAKPPSRWDQFEPPQFDKTPPTLQPFQPSDSRQPLQPFVPGQPFQTADMRDRGKPYYRSQRRRSAFMFVNGQLRPIHIVEKIDQQFASVATPWEHEFSAMTKDGGGRFALVNQDYLVVGHVGSIKGNEMIKAKDSPIRNTSYGGIEEFVAADEPVYVSRTFLKAGRSFSIGIRWPSLRSPRESTARSFPGTSPIQCRARFRSPVLSSTSLARPRS